VVFTAMHSKAKYCSRKCKLSHLPGGAPSRMLDTLRMTRCLVAETERTCIVCTATFTAKGSGQRCGPCRGVVGRRPCATCGLEFNARRREQLFCSPGCHQRQTCICVDCGASFDGALSSAKRCAGCRAIRQRARFRQKNAVRRGSRVRGRRMTITELGDRDSWRCHLCRRRVNRNLRAGHRMSPSFDHLIPISAGGFDAPENLALAHLQCNTRRGNRGPAQLLLIG
jgi:5-methylcytosine-specific restriction endonuclease McrA